VVFDCAAGVAPSDMVLTPTATAVAHDIGRVTSLVFEWV
jgi:hypothetical protein